MPNLEACNLNTNHLFVSYSRKDKIIAAKFADNLQKQENYSVWINRNQIPIGELYQEIKNGIKNAHIFICFISKSFISEVSCMKELKLACNQSKTILCIILERNAMNDFEPKNYKMFEFWSDGLYNKVTTTILDVLSQECDICFQSLYRNILSTRINIGKSKNIHEACQNEMIEDVRYFISDKNSIHGKRAETPLLIAAYRGNKDIVQLLLDNNADKTAKDTYGDSPLMNGGTANDIFKHFLTIGLF
jgi:hypothetical protein